MAMKPDVVAFLEKSKELGLKPMVELTPEGAREQMEATVRARKAPLPQVGAIESLAAEGPAGPIPLRLYRPQGADGALPALVYFHGGGHVIGSLDTHDAVARALCRDAGIVVVSVDYRMGPEHRFPAAVVDSYAATQWLAAQADRLGIRADRLAVGGDSAGGNLALVVALMAREQGGPALAFQLLVYPVTDYGGGTPSYATYGKGYGPLEAETMLWFRGHYLNGEVEIADWRASPARAARLAGLPPALVITAECDVLHDEGAQLAARLSEEGVATEHVDYAGMIHGFFSLAPLIEDATAAQALAADRLRAALF